MLRHLVKNIAYHATNTSSVTENIFHYQLLCQSHPFHKQIRTTWILRRKFPIKLVKYNDPLDSRKLRPYDYVYEVVENTNTNKLEPLRVLLIKPVPGIGSPGQIVEVKRNVARLKIILPGLGVYASPENLEKYAYLSDLAENRPSSPFALKTVISLQKTCYNISMNMETPWTIEKWHVRVAFRRSGVNVPEDAITLPEKPITGPDLSIEGKEFLVKLIINQREEAKVRMRVHHVTTHLANRLPWVEFHWKKLAKPIFPEEAEILATLNQSDPNMIPAED